MDIEFATSDLRSLCNQARIMTRRLGPACARKLMARLMDLQSVVSVMELSAGHPHPLKGDRLGQFALDLHDGKRLVFEPADSPVPRIDGAIAWGQVTKVRIVFVGDYHG